jgi:ATP-dependent Clp protease ATP-binding subunit ClpX
MLTEPKDALVRQYRHLFALDGIELEFEAAALRVIARRAMRLGTGARGLRTILESILLAPMFETLGRRGVAKVIVTGDAASGLVPPLRLQSAPAAETTASS